MRLQLLLLNLLFIGIFCSIESHRITYLPNLNGTLGNQYSGYINVAEDTDYFYWFVESPNDSSDLVLWLNGGPGCSSMEGFLYENGPFMWSSDSSTTLKDNPYSWHIKANMLYVDSPGGVGFSTAVNPIYNDESTAENLLKFLLNWFVAYPEYKRHRLYISGESYAGIYIPAFVHTILNRSKIDVKGILVGNGYTDNTEDSDINSLFPFLYSHGLYSSQTQSLIYEYCINNPNEDKCNEISNLVYMVFSKGLNIYNIYEDCYEQKLPPTKFRKYINFKDSSSKSNDGFSIPCFNSNNAANWLNLRSVKEAIHAKDIEWSTCNSYINMNYNRSIHSVIPYYREFIEKGIRVLVYSGDIDAAVPFIGTRNWTSKVGGVAISLWQPWRVDGRIGGFSTVYPNNFTFTTIRGAGHMVPQYRPKESYYMFSQWLDNKQF